ncbi:MAG: glycosyltransferase family 4 protein [Sphingobacteriaceae bacterium]|nr:glycosyltransferase family 4 protein [Sphingobacteriaceae bacterium]
MKIGYDGKRAANNLTGLGNYSRGLIEQLAQSFPNNEYLVYSPKVKKNPKIDAFFSIHSIFLKLPSNFTFLWRSFAILKDLAKDEVKIFHGLSHEIPFHIQYTPIKTVVTIHDLIFLRHPNYYKLIDRLIYKYKSKYACIHADKIIAISEKTKQDIVELYKIEPNKIEVIYQSCDDSFKQKLTLEIKLTVAKKYNLPQKYILYVGTIEPRKNLLTLIKSLPNIDEDYKLVVVGKETPYLKLVNAEIEKLGLKNRVHFFKNLPFVDLPAVYQNANIFCLPSLYEGFGIPIIEALFSGVPVVAAKGSCLEEAGGNDSLYVSAKDEIELAKAINEIILNPNQRLKMIEKGFEYVEKFDNTKISTQIMNLYENVIKTNQHA